MNAIEWIKLNEKVEAEKYYFNHHQISKINH